MSRAARWLCALALIVAAAAPAGAQDPGWPSGWVIERFHVTIDVDRDGTLRITEDIALDFRGLARRGIYRVIPVRYQLAESDQPPEGFTRDEVWRTISLDDIRVSSSAPDDVKVEGPGLTGHTTTIRVGDPDRTVRGPQTYRISYEIRGAMNERDGAAELQWNVTGNEWEAPILRASAEVRGQAVASVSCFRGPTGSLTPCGQATHAGTTAQVAAENLHPGSGLTVLVGFAPGAVAVGEPRIEPRWTLQRGLTGSPAALPLTALVALLALVGLGILLYRQGRDRETRGGVSVDGHLDPHPQRRRLFSPRPTPVQYRPPGDLRPAQLGLIVDERVDPVEISATIVDLAVRGHLTIVEQEVPRLLLRSRTDWTLRRAEEPPDDDLLPYERRLINALFKDGSEVALSDLQGTFHTDYAKVVKDIYADGVERGWFPNSPETTRTVWFGIGVVALVAAVGLTVAATIFATIGLAGVPLIVGGVVLIAAHRWMPHRTAKGSQRLVETLGFKEFIEAAETGRMEFAEAENLFVTYLPYAVVFGAVDKWASAFAALGVATAAAGTGAWYVSSSGRAPDLSRLSGGLSDFSSRVGASLPTAPASSGSGGGGGSSGGGFGGGGGGSW